MRWPRARSPLLMAPANCLWIWTSQKEKKKSFKDVRASYSPQILSLAAKYNCMSQAASMASQRYRTKLSRFYNQSMKLSPVTTRSMKIWIVRIKLLPTATLRRSLLLVSRRSVWIRTNYCLPSEETLKYYSTKIKIIH